MSARPFEGTKVISGLGFGCSSYWARSSFPAEEAIELVLKSYELGINYFDTGSSYSSGQAELRLGDAISLLDRNELIISTKVGTFVDGQGSPGRSFNPDRLRGSLEGSLSRLRLSHVDILYLHGPRPEDLTTKVLDFLLRMKDDGLISLTGVNTFDRSVMRRLVGMPIDVVMPQYNIYDVDCMEEIVPLYRSGKKIISATALGQGKVNLRNLVPKNKKSFWYLLRMLKNDPLFPLTKIRAAARIRHYGPDPLDAAILFLLQNTLIMSSVFGTTSVAHLEGNLAAARRTLPFGEELT